jgi:hypothetical protein
MNRVVTQKSCTLALPGQPGFAALPLPRQGEVPKGRGGFGGRASGVNTNAEHWHERAKGILRHHPSQGGVPSGRDGSDLGVT